MKILLTAYGYPTWSLFAIVEIASRKEHTPRRYLWKFFNFSMKLLPLFKQQNLFVWKFLSRVIVNVFKILSEKADL